MHGEISKTRLNYNNGKSVVGRASLPGFWHRELEEDSDESDHDERPRRPHCHGRCLVDVLLNLSDLQGLENHGDEDEEGHGGVELTPVIFEIGLLGEEETPSPDLGDHLGHEHDQTEDVAGVGHVLQTRVHFEGLGGVETDRDEADETEEAEEPPDVGAVDPEDVAALVQGLIGSVVRSDHGGLGAHDALLSLEHVNGNEVLSSPRVYIFFVFSPFLLPPVTARLFCSLALRSIRCVLRPPKRGKEVGQSD